MGLMPFYNIASLANIYSFFIKGLNIEFSKQIDAFVIAFQTIKNSIWKNYCKKCIHLIQLYVNKMFLKVYFSVGHNVKHSF
ncbi:hypothetical protein GDO78_012537 [Eleutherodactylus coqui]|uniref:Uncharacterized protein n=1 Tax=Eleutherodactylus coqui TaxID=57060 RepID=A0A8J6K2W0_ELECQ|nr:hypothetical protein GDO78_012537 [Eleutherodactylus coqui]